MMMVTAEGKGGSSCLRNLDKKDSVNDLQNFVEAGSLSRRGRVDKKHRPLRC